MIRLFLICLLWMNCLGSVLIGPQFDTSEGKPLLCIQLCQSDRVIHMCGGVLITRKSVLTAGHCVQGVFPAKLYVSLGNYDLSAVEIGEATIKARNIISHPLYNHGTLDNDIAVIHLAKDAPVIPSIGPIKWLKDSDFLELSEDLNLRVLGWGAVSDGGTHVDILRSVELPYVSQLLCTIAMHPFRIGKGMFCAGDLLNGGIDACQGDSGGPIVIKKSQYKAFLKEKGSSQKEKNESDQEESYSFEDALVFSLWGKQAHRGQAHKEVTEPHPHNEQPTLNKIIKGLTKDIRRSSNDETEAMPSESSKGSQKPSAMSPKARSFAWMLSMQDSKTVSELSQKAAEAAFDDDDDGKEEDEDDGWLLVGVVSWGVGCGSPGFAGVYTSLPHYSKWVESVVI